MMQPFNLKPLCLPSVSSIRGFVGICKQIPSLPSELYVSIHLFPCIFISVICIYITVEYDVAVPEAEREQLKGDAFKGVLGAAQEAIVISPWVAIAVRPKPGVWEYLRVDVSKLAVEELSVSEYLQFKEQLVEGSTMVGSSKPCELRPPMSAFMCGSFISRPHNMELIAIFDPVHLEAGAP